ncbi:MAG: GNAT family N-acetyltransferase [Bacteroidales bacterium]|nr:GNAT family N-acetyltransferase [Bacteroidales bacterium]
MDYAITGVLHHLIQKESGNYNYRKIAVSDLNNLQILINSQVKDDLKFFNPHGFDLKSLERQYKNPAFLMMGAFDGDKMIGYFFLRFFINKKCFVGRLIDKDYRGKGIGQVMNTIMYETAWKMGFRCLSTISKNNEMVMKAHARNPYMKILKELDNDYLLVEFVRQ